MLETRKQNKMINRRRRKILLNFTYSLLLRICETVQRYLPLLHRWVHIQLV